MQTGRSGNRPERIVRCQMDVMRFAPPGNFACLGQSTGNAQVNAAVIHQILLNDFSECPLAIKLFPDSKRDGGLLAESPQTGWVFTAQRIFNEKRIVRSNSIAEIEAIRRVEPGMHVN